MLDRVDFHKRIDLFREKFFGNTDILWAFQKFDKNKKQGKPWYEPPQCETCGMLKECGHRRRPVDDDEIYFHFNQKPRSQRYRQAGEISTTFTASLAVKFRKEDQMLAHWWAVDIDAGRSVDLFREKALPVLKDWGVEYIWETGGTSEDGEERAKIWVFCKPGTTRLALKSFQQRLLQTADMQNWRKEKHEFEWYITDKPNNLLRIMGGFHCKTWSVHDIIRSWDGERGSDGLFVMDSIIEAPPFDFSALVQSLAGQSAEVQEIVLSKKPEKQEYTSRSKPKTKFFHDRNLPLPLEDLPPFVASQARNCQAFNRLLVETIEEGKLDVPGDQTHKFGLFLMNAFKYNDLKLCSKNGEGKQYARVFFDRFRNRDYTSHKWWDWSSDDYRSIDRKMSGCAQYETTFNECEDCPVRNRPDFKNPLLFYWNEPIHKEIRKLKGKIAPAAEIRKKAFKQVWEEIKYALENNEPLDLVLALHQGGRKSTFADRLAAAIANQGGTVLIAVPAGKLAMEHYLRTISQLLPGVKIFVALSLQNLFEHFVPKCGKRKFECPHLTEMLADQQLGLLNSYLKKKYCAGCPFYSECPFPEQYSNIQKEEYRVVVIQHAHFQADKALYQILKRKFNVMVVDETFIDACQKIMEPKPAEIALLDKGCEDVEWAKKLAKWLKGEVYPDSTVYAKEEDLLSLQESYSQHELDWTVPDYVRAYNDGKIVDDEDGLRIFYPLPTSHKVPIRLFTDATPPVEMIKAALNIRNLKVIGRGDIFDPREFNPDNLTIQLLDATSSKSRMSDTLRLTNILNRIAFDATEGEHAGLIHMITTYADFEDPIKDFYAQHYPKFWQSGRLIVSHMAVGTNEFAHVNVQWLLAGVHFCALQFHKAVYEYRDMINFYRVLRGEAPVSNPLPYNIDENSNIESKEWNVVRNEPVGNGQYALMQYPQFKKLMPLHSHFLTVHKNNVARRQQACRIRYPENLKLTDKRQSLRRLIIWDKEYYSGLLIHESKLESEMLAMPKYFAEYLGA
jgi:hypothetical protein